MENPHQVLVELKCSECDKLLSCGPVYSLLETGETICGCYSQQSQENNPKKNSDRTRNKPFEATASLLTFPCTHAARGCPKKESFSLGRPAHELNCKFRPFICPFESRNSCEWIGSWYKLKQHCEQKHPENIFENPCNPPRPNLFVSNLQTYVISAFRFLFLFHVKVCLTSGKLFHSLRMFGDQEMLKKFSYSVEIEGIDSKFVKKGSVLPPDLMMLQEPTAICSSINNILEILDGKYDESKFTITIQPSINLNCINCLKNIKDVSDSKFFCECQRKLVKCKFNEKKCSFVDFDRSKFGKHEKMFGKYQTDCFWCEVNFVNDLFMEHLCSINFT